MIQKYSELAFFFSNLNYGKIGICEQLANAASLIGWNYPSEIQQKTIPLILTGKDVICISHPGSGKTGAFTIPILQRLLNKPEPTFAIIISSTRELAFQIEEQLSLLGSEFGVKCCLLVGGFALVQQTTLLTRKSHILVGTPGRIIYHMLMFKATNLGTLKNLTIDEADKLLNTNFEKDIDQIFKIFPQNRRTQLFSAFITNIIYKLRYCCLKDPVLVKVPNKSLISELFKHKYLTVPEEQKNLYLIFILSMFKTNTIMIFTQKCKTTNTLALILENLRFKITSIHGRMSKSRKLKILKNFRSGHISILILTDLASRDLDIQTADLVINYDVPLQTQDYFNRLCKTARKRGIGNVITLVTQNDIGLFLKIERSIKDRTQKIILDRNLVLPLFERIEQSFT